MKYLDGNYYVELKDHRYRIQPTEKKILSNRDPPPSLRTQYQVQNDTQIKKNQKVIKNDNNQLVVKNYPEKKQPIQQPKFKQPNCPACKQKSCLEFDKGFYCRKCEYIINKQEHQIDKKVRRQHHNFSTRLPYANEKSREIWMNMIITTYNTTEDMINNLQSLKGKTKLKFYKNKSNYYENLNIKMDEDPFARKAQGISKIYNGVLILLKFLQTKPQVKNMNTNYYELYYTVIKNRDEKEVEDNQYENDYIKFNDIIPNHYGRPKNENEVLR